MVMKQRAPIQSTQGWESNFGFLKTCPEFLGFEEFEARSASYSGIPQIWTEREARRASTASVGGGPAERDCKKIKKNTHTKKKAHGIIIIHRGNSQMKRTSDSADSPTTSKKKPKKKGISSF